MKRIILLGLVGGLLAVNSGCGLFQAIFCYRPCMSRGDCGPGGCGECCDNTCAPACAPACGPARCPARPLACASRCTQSCSDCDTCCETPCGRPCRAPCGSCSSCCTTCGDSCTDSCGDGGCGHCWHRGPLSCIFALFTPAYWCGRGCGERYWGDFYSDAPDCWDPCDCHGNYTGGCHSAGGGCRTCGGGSTDEGASMPGEKVLSQTDQAVGPTPRPATQPHKAMKPQPEQ